MVAYYATSALWLTFATLACATLLANKQPGNCIRILRAPLRLLAVLSLITIICLAASLHWGLEYEDAFEYGYGAQFLSRNDQDNAVSLNSVCIDGSIEECSISASLSHPSGVATLASWFVPLFSSDAAVVPWLSVLMLVLSCGALIVVACICHGGVVAVVSAVGLLLGTPRLVSYYGTGFSEPFASLPLLIAVGCSLCLWKTKRVDRVLVLVYALLSVSVSVSVLCRRENIAFPPLMFAGLLVSELVTKSSKPVVRPSLGYVVGAAMLGAGIAAAVVGRELLSTSVIAPVERFPFSIANVGVLGRAYVSHACPSLIPIFALAVLALLLPGHRNTAVTIGIVVLGYLLIFVAFDQDYYTVTDAETPLLHFERYTAELAPLLALLAGLGVESMAGEVANWIAKPPLLAAPIGIVAVTLFVLVGSWHTVLTRSERFKAENHQRAAPVLDACRTAGPRIAILTDQPVLVGVYCGAQQRVVDLSSVGKTLRAEDMRNRFLDGDVMYLRDFDVEAHLGKRYPAAASFVRQLDLELVADYSHSYRHIGLYRIRRTLR